MRRKAIGAQFNACGRLTLGNPPSRTWNGYGSAISDRRNIVKQVISDPQEGAMACAVRSKQPAFVEASQSISDFPLDARETGAIGGVKTLLCVRAGLFIT
ncbi:hypothetical protein [Methylocella sp.]|jgi:hypothetical protein|uniref:hypothetical protein n=1 Tax=Methylocella sp. TaxID=1978226 RepID=UPI003C18D62E